ncbi:MAG TPA: ABC transporter ATP-binding protein [Candidatus Competibacteraceae bacterium]|nr:ABC transporter ATP-binding protein [Candidatus Competibacteraceae bacterium]
MRPPPSPLIELRGLGKSYREGERSRSVFQGLTLAIERGAQVALLGPSGSGKSTLLNLLAGIDLPDAGTLKVDGIELPRLDEGARTRFRRRHVGFVFQFFNLIPTLTVAENIRLPLELNGLDTPAELARVAALLARVGLQDRQHSYPEQLSGGEQQRVACLRALIHRPALLLADEPTGNLDIASGRRVLELLLELTAEAGSTLLLVTHSNEVAETCERVLELRQGRLVQVRP